MISYTNKIILIIICSLFSVCNIHIPDRTWRVRFLKLPVIKDHRITAKKKGRKQYYEYKKIGID